MSSEFETKKSISSEEIVDLKERLLSQSPNYIDFLALTISKCKTTEFDSDISKWNKVIVEFKEEECSSGFDLFNEVYFDMRDPSNPYSSEVTGFLAVMRRSGSFILWTTGGYGRYRMTKEVKEDIIKNEEQVFQSQKEYLTRLTSKIDSQLGIHFS